MVNDCVYFIGQFLPQFFTYLNPVKYFQLNSKTNMPSSGTDTTLPSCSIFIYFA